MEKSSAPDFSAKLYYQLHEALKLLQADFDSAERTLAAKMVNSAKDWFEISEEIKFLTSLELALDEAGQNAIQPILRPRLVKLFVDAKRQMDELTAQIETQVGSNLLPQANALLDEGRALVDTLAHEFGPFL
jgi:hypothetical protein